MNLTQISLGEILNSQIDSLSEEAYKYGVYRGEGSAIGDRYATLGGPPFDSTIRDYIKEKFGAEGNLIQLSRVITQIPLSILEELQKGFHDGYNQCHSQIDYEEDNENY